MTTVFPAFEKHITLEKMQAFMGHVKDSIHSNPEMAKSWGVGGAIVQGGHLVAFLNELMLRTFGRGYAEGGEISVTFIKAVRPGDTVTPKAEARETAMVEGRPQVECEVWLENQDAEKVCVGTARAFAA
jgi:acyl dehydratase